MAASVRIEDEAFADARIEMLGTLAGFNRYEALGRMAHLWRVCTLRETYTLDPVWIDACLGPKGHEHLVAAGLGERVDGGIRIRGTSGRIEWLGQRRQAARKGGAATKSRKAAGPGPEGGQAGAKPEPNASQVASQPASRVEAKREPNGGPLTLTPCLLSEDKDPLPPDGAGDENPGSEDSSRGPRPREVVALWNAQAKLTPCSSSDPGRNQKINGWAVGNPDWRRHWRTVIEFMGRTPHYTGDVPGWIPTIDWLFQGSNFSKALDAALAAARPRLADRPNYDAWRAAEQSYEGMMGTCKRKEPNDNRAA